MSNSKLSRLQFYARTPKRREQQRLEQEAKLKHETLEMERAMNEQRKEFQLKYASAEKTNKDSLRNQDQVFLQELYKLKQRYGDRIDKETNQSSDPFYQMRNFDAKLDESANSYTLTAKVAPHEVENVEVRVKDNKVTLAARRNYDNAFKEGESKVSTNTYQSYRQEFKLDRPADGERAVKTIKPDGTITVSVPKKGFSNT